MLINLIQIHQSIIHKSMIHEALNSGQTRRISRDSSRFKPQPLIGCEQSRQNHDCHRLPPTVMNCHRPPPITCLFLIILLPSNSATTHEQLTPASQRNTKPDSPNYYHPVSVFRNKIPPLSILRICPLSRQPQTQLALAPTCLTRWPSIHTTTTK